MVEGRVRQILERLLKSSRFHNRHRIRALMTSFDEVSFPGDENRDGTRNIGLMALQAPDAAASPRKFH
jgi:hypothetical protein